MLKNISMITTIISYLTLSVSAIASPITIPQGTTGISPIAGLVVNISNQGNTTKVDLKFTLQGCLDNLLPLIYQVDNKGNKTILYITALNAHNEASLRARCVAIPQATSTITLQKAIRPSKVKVIFLETVN